MMKRYLTALVAASVMLAAQPVVADDLTDDQIEGFIATLSELDRLAERYDEMEELDDMADEQRDATEGGEFNPLSMAVSEMEGHEILDEFSDVVTSHGFSDPDDWASTGDRIIRAMMALEMQQEGHGDMREEMDQAMAEMEDNPNVSDEQREQMRQQMEQAVGGMEAMADAPQADIDAVQPHAEALRGQMQE